MTTVITVQPREKSTATITLSFTKEDGTTIVPVTAFWQLQRTDGTIVNNREFADCSFTGTEIVLSGLDLAIFGSSDDGTRIFSFQVTYTPDTGDDLPLNDECRFNIHRLLSQVDAS